MTLKTQFWFKGKLRHHSLHHYIVSCILIIDISCLLDLCEQLRVSVILPLILAQVEDGLHVGRLAEYDLCFPHLLLLIFDVIEIRLRVRSTQALRVLIDHDVVIAASMSRLCSLHLFLEFLWLDLREEFLSISALDATLTSLWQHLG